MSEQNPTPAAPGGAEAPGDEATAHGRAAPDEVDPVPPTRRLAALAIPAVVVGAVSAFMLWALSALAGLIQDAVWTSVPESLGVAADTRWWPIVILTLTGLAVGAVVRWMPGHAGPDPLRTGLVAAPLRMAVVPGLAITLVLGLAGGVSLGPENPIIAINVALAVWLIARPKVGVTPQLADGLAAAGTLGAMFGSPLAAILLMTETLGGKNTTRLFDRLFGPLCAATAGTLVMKALGEGGLSAAVAAYDDPGPWDMLSGPLVAIAAALVTLIGVWAMPLTHRLFHTLRSPVLALGLGGFVLGVLGLIAGHGNITLFKGLTETQEIVVEAPKESWGPLLLLALALIKVLAVTVAAGAGFRGGRIFPAVFIGTTVGLSAVALVPAVPQPVGIACGILGAVVVMSRDGWVSIFIAALMVGDVRVLPLLCLAMIPLWLVARSAPLMQLPPSAEPEFAALGAPKGAEAAGAPAKGEAIRDG